MARRRVLAFLACLFLLACSSSNENQDRFREPVVLLEVGPEVVLAGSSLRIQGEGFVHPDYGTNRLHLLGEVSGRAVDVMLDAAFISSSELEVAVSVELLDAVPVGATLVGGARIETTHSVGAGSRSGALSIQLQVVSELVPSVTLRPPAQTYINGEIPVQGEGLLLGGAEGATTARVWGCYFLASGGGCQGVEPVEVPVLSTSTSARNVGAFRFEPQVAGVQPGVFRGSVQIINRHGPERNGARINQDPVEVEIEILRPRINEIDETFASLGQYITLRGGGFVFADSASVTLLEVTARFTPDGDGRDRSVNLSLVPEIRNGTELRYLLNESDQLGEQINLRRERGRLAGVVSVVVRHGDDEVVGDATNFSVRIDSVRQVVYVAFQPSYAETLRSFGLRALRPLINERVLAAAQEPYTGVNVEFRDELPDDFALFSTVDLAGPDPNGLGLFGYDNTPGKDNNNLRLFDRIGGVNATTQEDGFPGFGGVFLDSFFGFSSDPGGRAEPLPANSPLFDVIFDPFRPDRDGLPVSAADLSAGLGDAQDGRACPARDRPTQIACAVWVLGNLVGSTVAHEVGHSLGLADPGGEQFHNDFDGPERLMDSGGARPFSERAVLEGQGPAVFCEEGYEYLREIMPSNDRDPLAERPSCF